MKRNQAEYLLEYDARMDCFVAIPPNSDMDAETLCGDTEQEARQFAAAVGIKLL
jgi:hypothetical protein